MNDKKYGMIIPFFSGSSMIGNTCSLSGFSQKIIDKYTILGNYPWNYASLIYLMQVREEENTEKQHADSITCTWKLLLMFIKQSKLSQYNLGNSGIFISNLKKTIEMNLSLIRNRDYPVYEQIRKIYLSFQEYDSKELNQVIQLIEKNSFKIAMERENSENRRKTGLPFYRNIKPKSLYVPFKVMMEQVQRKIKLPSARELFFKSVQQQQNIFYQKVLTSADPYYDSDRQTEYSQYFLKILQMKLETQQRLIYLDADKEIDGQKTFFQENLMEYTHEYDKALKEMQEIILTRIRQQEDVNEKIILNGRRNGFLNISAIMRKKEIVQIALKLISFLPSEIFEQADRPLDKVRILQEWNQLDTSHRIEILQSLQTVCTKKNQNWQEEDHIVFHIEKEEEIIEQRDFTLLNRKLQELQEFETMITQMQKTGLVMKLLSKATTALDRQVEKKLELEQILGNWVHMDVDEQLTILNTISKTTDDRVTEIDREDLIQVNEDYLEIIHREELVQLQRNLLETEEKKQKLTEIEEKKQKFTEMEQKKQKFIETEEKKQKLTEMEQTVIVYHEEESLLQLLQKLPKIVYEQTEERLKKETLITQWTSLEESKQIGLLSDIRKSISHLLELHREDFIQTNKDYSEIIRREELVQLQQNLTDMEETKRNPIETERTVNSYHEEEPLLQLLKKIPKILYEQTQERLKKENLITQWTPLEESNRIERLSLMEKPTAYEWYLKENVYSGFAEGDRNYEMIITRKENKNFTDHLYGKELQTVTLNEKNVTDSYTRSESMIYSFVKESRTEQQKEAEPPRADKERIETWITKQEYTMEKDKSRIEELKHRLELQGEQLARLQEGEIILKKNTNTDPYKISPKLMSRLKSELHLERIRHGME